jgi:membrane-associated phospholipid phosphatase
VVALCGALAALPAGASSPYALGLGVDIALGVTGASALGAGLLLRGVAMPPAVPLDSARVFALDRPFLAPYSHAPDLVSDLTMAAAIAAPAVALLSRNLGDILTIVVMYAETIALAQGLKETMKGTFPRYRPYMYDNPPAALAVDPDRYASFPSGHAALAFASAAFLASVFAAYNPGSPWTIPVAAGGFALAGATAVLRMVAGQHFLSDVLVGAALGSVCGIVVPVLHRVRAKSVDAAHSTTLRFSLEVR